MGTDLKSELLPPIKLNFPISRSINYLLKSITLLFEFYGIPSMESEEIKEKILNLLKDLESMRKEGRVDMNILSQKERVEIEIFIPEDWMKKNVIFSFKSRKIELIQIGKRGEKVSIKLGVKVHR